MTREGLEDSRRELGLCLVCDGPRIDPDGQVRYCEYCPPHWPIPPDMRVVSVTESPHVGVIYGRVEWVEAEETGHRHSQAIHGD
jgi:hypothetical protein